MTALIPFQRKKILLARHLSCLAANSILVEGPSTGFSERTQLPKT